MLSLSDDDRELWLSRYLDGELDASEKEAVDAKLRTDEKWRGEFEGLQRSDTTICAVAVKFSEADGDEFSGRITQKLKPVAQKPAVNAARVHTVHAAHSSKGAAHRRLSVVRRSNREAAAWQFGLVASIAVLIGAGLVWKFVADRSDSRVSSVPAKAEPGITVTEEVRSISLPDGTKILARRGSSLQSIDDRTVKLSGEAFFYVAKNSRPFTVIVGDNQKVQALGTRFEVTTVGEAARVRVAEGLVRVQSDSSHSIEVRGGTEVSSDLKTRQFDSRELSAAWNQSAEIIAPWSQPGGSSAHSGATPLNGPFNLVAKREAYYPYPETYEAPATGAVLSASNRAYVVARSGGEIRLLELRVVDGKPSWNVCTANTASPEISPVITPRGLVITAVFDGSVSAYDPATGVLAWKYKEHAGIRGLCAAPDESVLLSTPSGLTAVDGRDGKLLWNCSEAKELSTAATVMGSGLICASSDSGKVYLIDGGRVVSSYSWSHSVAHPPVAVPLIAALGIDQVWLTSNDGYVACMALDRGTMVEKYFGWQLKCSPISSGLLGTGSMVTHFDQPAAVTAPAEDTVVALVEDRRGEVYAGYRRGVLHVKARTPADAIARMKEMDFANLAAGSGEIVKNGLALTPGKLLVTTTKGIQIFE